MEKCDCNKLKVQKSLKLIVCFGLLLRSISPIIYVCIPKESAGVIKRKSDSLSFFLTLRKSLNYCELWNYTFLFTKIIVTLITHFTYTFFKKNFFCLYKYFINIYNMPFNNVQGILNINIHIDYIFFMCLKKHLSIFPLAITWNSTAGSQGWQVLDRMAILTPIKNE